MNKRWLAVGVLLFALALAWWFLKGKPSYMPTLEETQAVLRSQIGKLEFPPAKESAGGSLADVPQGIRSFVPSDAAGITVSRVVYEDGSAGYAIAFTVSRDLFTVYDGLLRSFRRAGWEIAGAARTALSSLIEAENDEYAVRVSQSLIGNREKSSGTAVTLEAIMK